LREKKRGEKKRGCGILWRRETHLLSLFFFSPLPEKVKSGRKK
jgi:hypothetical protein